MIGCSDWAQEGLDRRTQRLRVWRSRRSTQSLFVCFGSESAIGFAHCLAQCFLSRHVLSHKSYPSLKPKAMFVVCLVVRLWQFAPFGPFWPLFILTIEGSKIWIICSDLVRVNGIVGLRVELKEKHCLNRSVMNAISYSIVHWILFET